MIPRIALCLLSVWPAVAAADPIDWWRASPPCPEGSALIGEQGKRLTCERSDGTRHGPATVWRASGQRWVDGQYLDGEQHGTWTHWHNSGRPAAEIVYDHGSALKESKFDNNGMVVDVVDHRTLPRHIEPTPDPPRPPPAPKPAGPGAPVYIFGQGRLGWGGEGLAGGAALGVVVGHVLIEGRIVHTREFSPFATTERIPNQDASDTALLVGYEHRGRVTRLNLAAGPGYFFGTERGEVVSRAGCADAVECTWVQHASIDRSGWGLATEASAFLAGKTVAGGLTAFANLNGERSFGGVMLSLQVGGLLAGAY